MTTTTHDDNAATWRDLADQLTIDQVARFERMERLCESDAHKAFPNEERDQVVAEIRGGLLQEARWEAEQNLTDQHVFGHVPMPAGVKSAEHWEDDGTGAWTRRLSVSRRGVDRPGADSTVYVDGVQSADGAVKWSLFILAYGREALSPQQARLLAAHLIEAADEVDELDYLQAAAGCARCDDRGRIRTGTTRDGAATFRASLCRHDAEERD